MRLFAIGNKRWVLVLLAFLAALYLTFCGLIEFSEPWISLQPYFIVASLVILFVLGILEGRWLLLISAMCIPFSVLLVENVAGQALSLFPPIGFVLGSLSMRLSGMRQSGKVDYWLVGLLAVYVSFTALSCDVPVLFFMERQAAMELFLPLGLVLGMVAVIDRTLFVRETMLAFAAGGLLVLLYSFLFSPWQGKMMPFPFFQNANVFSGMLAMTLPFLAWEVLVWRGWQRYVFGGIAIAFVAGIIAFQSRGAWLGLGGAVLLGLFYYLPKLGQKLALLAIAASGAVALLAFQPAHPVAEPETTLEKVASMADTEYNFSNRERLMRWECALRIAEAHPILGCGLGEYENVFRQYLTDWSEVQRISYWHGWTGQAHSDYLTRLAERGIFAFLAFLGMIVLLLLQLHRLQRDKVWGRNFVAFVAASLGAWLSQGLVEDLSLSTAIWAPLALLAVAVFTARFTSPAKSEAAQAARKPMPPKYLRNNNPDQAENFSP